MTALPDLAPQVRFFQEGSMRPVEARLVVLKRLEQTFSDRREDVLQALADDLGKAELEAFLSEFYFVLTEIRLFRKKLKGWLRPRRASTPIYYQPAKSWSQLEPLGQSLIYSPWNYPIQLALAPLVASVAAGNTVVLKPSELAPASAAFLEKLVQDVFDPDHVTVVQGDAEVSEKLLDLPFDHVFFTGSTEVGRSVYQKAAKQLIPCVLELGGKCPCVVDGTFDLQVTAQRILFGKLFNGGQTCFAPDFVAVAADVHDDLLKALERELEAHPWEKELARIISPRHYKRLQNILRLTSISSTTEFYQKSENRPDDLYQGPRLLFNNHWDSPAMEEEIFGPILPLVPYQSEDELFENLPLEGKPLALYVFSEKKEFVAKLTARVPSGSVGWNDVSKQASNLDLPFGGVGASGFGRYRGKFGLEEFSNLRAYTKRPAWGNFMTPTPPYDKMTEMLKKFLK